MFLQSPTAHFCVTIECANATGGSNTVAQSDPTGYFSGTAHRSGGPTKKKLAEKSSCGWFCKSFKKGKKAAQEVGSKTANLISNNSEAIRKVMWDTAAIGAGAALVVLSAGGEVGGGALCITGVGCFAGAPLIALSTTGIVAGVGIAGVGAYQLGQDARGLRWDTSAAGEQGGVAPGLGQRGGGPKPSTTVSRQKQGRHVQGDPLHANTGKSYFNRHEDAQSVLDAYHNGDGTVLGQTSNGNIVVRYGNVTGYNNNPGAGFFDQPTNVFMIKGTKSPSVVPMNPNWTP